MKLQHDETGRFLDWPDDKPIPKGYSCIQLLDEEYEILNMGVANATPQDKEIKNEISESIERKE